jgi:hypothetical protein
MTVKDGSRSRSVVSNFLLRTIKPTLWDWFFPSSADEGSLVPDECRIILLRLAVGGETLGGAFTSLEGRQIRMSCPAPRCYVAVGAAS